MKNKIIVFAAIFLLGNIKLIARDVQSTESLVERLGGFAVQYDITTNGEPIGVLRQYMVKRQNYHTWTDGATNYEVWHLSLAAENGFQKTQGVEFRDAGPGDYRLQFFDADNRLVGTKFIENKDVVFAFDRGVDDLFYCDISLRTVPLIILEDAVRIDIVRRHNWRQLEWQPY
ncbi:MAG: hypothetical protein AAFY36_02795 [Bacteroidota bacterium]